MSQNFHHTLYISNHNVSPMEICTWMSQIFIIYCVSVTTMSLQWKSAAQMLQIFHYILYICDYNVTPMEICGINVTEFSWYVVYKWLQCLTNGSLWHKHCRFFIIYCIVVTTMEIRGTNVADFHHIFYISDYYNVTSTEICHVVLLRPIPPCTHVNISVLNTEWP
jgi:hypothetical protein